MKLSPQQKSHFQKVLKDELGHLNTEIIVTSVIPLTHAQKTQIASNFSTQERSVNVVNIIDTSLIAGMKVEFNSQIADFSIISKLSNLHS